MMPCYRTSNLDNARAFVELLRLLGYSENKDRRHGVNVRKDEYRLKRYQEPRSDRACQWVYRVTYFGSPLIPHRPKREVKNPNRTCGSDEGCDRPTKAYGLCGKHYDRWRYQTDEAWRERNRRKSRDFQRAKVRAALRQAA